MVLKANNVQRMVLMKINENGNKLMNDVTYQIKD
jgi:hypothetical protein